tara:strand:- start:56618 stop:57829 length:1212 start_codon:yes stop_codon:yes gene_type:complete
MVQLIGKIGGVNGAARALSTSQPAVTQAVSNIEADIGAPLFDRCASGSFPTDHGKQFLLRVDRFFDILDAAVGRVLTWRTEGPEVNEPQADRLITNTQLRSFVVACETGRVREIAQSLGLTDASLFRSARSLERVLGNSLFDRTASGPVPNKTGKRLARDFGRALREIELARGEVRFSMGRESLEIVVGVPPLPGSHELVRATRDFMIAFPKVKLRFVTGEYQKLLRDLSSGHLDLMFGILRLPEWVDDLQEEVLYDDDSCVITRPMHPLILRDRVTPEDLAQYDWLVPPPGTPRRARIEAIFEGSATSPLFSIETASLSLSRAFLLGSDAITLMARSEIQHELDLGLLAAISFKLSDQKQPKGLTTRVDWLPTQAHRAFIECLRVATAVQSSANPAKCKLGA